MPRGRIAQQRPIDPAIGGEREMAQRLNERPFAIDLFVQQCGVETTGLRHSGPPQVLNDGPGAPEPVGVGRSQFRSLGMKPVEFGLDEGNDVDIVDAQALKLAANHHIAHPRSTEPHTTQVDVTKSGATEADLIEPSACQVDLMEVGTRQVLLEELICHVSTVRHVTGHFRPNADAEIVMTTLARREKVRAHKLLNAPAGPE